jgi:hydrogenase/urease accessory protein HupE
VSARRILAARWLYGWSGVLALLMGSALPVPPRGRDALTLAILAACLAASVALAVGLRRWYSTLRPLSGVLGIYGLYTLGCVLWTLRTAEGSEIPSAAMAGSFALGYVIAMLLLARVPSAAGEPAPG